MTLSVQMPADTPYETLIESHFRYPGVKTGDSPVSLCIAVPRMEVTGSSEPGILGISGLELFQIFQLSGKSAGGRGLSDPEARIRCQGEVAEVLATRFNGDEVMVRASAKALGDQAIPANDICLFSEEQLAKYNVPANFLPTQELDWVEFENLSHGRRRMVPTHLVYSDYMQSIDSQVEDIADSNGCAAGENPNAAMVAGFLELVERDATAIWWYGKLSRPAVDEARLENSDTRELLNWARQRSRSLTLLDITTDLRIPVVAAISANDCGGELCMGFAANFDPDRAVVSALLEMVQVESIVEFQQKLDQSASHSLMRPGLKHWLTNVNLSNQPHLVPAPKQRGGASNWHDQSLSGGGSVLEHCIAICRSAGLELLVKDLTREGLGLHVFRVIVPGLRHYQPRFAPGRLYDVPVKLGWISGQMQESEMNPQDIAI